MKKPYPDFPLSPHSTGQWAKKINGRRYYFGTDWKEALAKYEKLIKAPPPKRGVTVIADLIESFMDDACNDEPAVYLTMGHADNRIWAVYRHRIDDSRLMAVGQLVRTWLLHS